MEKKRIIVDYKTLPESILEAISVKFPDGYSDNDIINFRNAKGDTISAIRLETEETIYMVKVSIQLKTMIEQYDSDTEDDEDDIDSDEKEAIDFQLTPDDEDLEDAEDEEENRNVIRNDFEDNDIDEDDVEED